MFKFGYDQLAPCICPPCSVCCLITFSYYQQIFYMLTHFRAITAPTEKNEPLKTFPRSQKLKKKYKKEEKQEK